MYSRSFSLCAVAEIALRFSQERLEDALCDVEEAWSLDPTSSLVHELGKEIAGEIRSQNATAAAAHQARIDQAEHRAAVKIQARYRGRLVLRSIAPHGGDGYWVHLGNLDVPVYPPKTDLVARFTAEEEEQQQAAAAAALADGGGGGGASDTVRLLPSAAGLGGPGERAQVLTIADGGRPDSRDSARSGHGGSRPGTPEYAMRVVTSEQRAAARRTASRMLVEKHKFLKLPIVLGMQQSWLHIPPFARLEDVISCALKEPALFPKTYAEPSKGPTVDAVLAGGLKLRRGKMSHMGDAQYQPVGPEAREKTLAEMLVEQGDGLILAGGY